MFAKLRLSLVIFVITYVAGVVLFRFIEGWTWLDSFYFVGTTINALGYGDFYPLTDLGKIFTTIYSFIGISIFIYIINVVVAIHDKK